MKGLIKMKIFNQQLLDLKYDLFGKNHYLRAFFAFISVIMSALFGYLIYDVLINSSPAFIHVTSPLLILFASAIDIIFCGIFTVGFIVYAITSINNAIKQKKLETDNIILQATKLRDEQFGRKLFYQLSKLYQIYIKRINNNKLFDDQIRQLFIDLDNQLYDAIMLLKNPKILENNKHSKLMDKNNKQLKSLEMNNNQIYLKLYKAIILEEEVEQMESCFNDFKENFPYYENKKTEAEFSQFLDDLYLMIMKFKNNEINSLSDYEHQEHEIWKILNSINFKRYDD